MTIEVNPTSGGGVLASQAAALLGCMKPRGVTMTRDPFAGSADVITCATYASGQNAPWRPPNMPTAGK